MNVFHITAHIFKKYIYKVARYNCAPAKHKCMGTAIISVQITVYANRMNLYTVRAKYSDGVDTKERKWAPPSDEGLEVYFRPIMELTLLCS